MRSYCLDKKYAFYAEIFKKHTRAFFVQNVDF